MVPRLLIFFILKTYFGRATRKLANDYCNEHLRRVNTQETLRFNKRCKRNDVIPPTLLQRPPTRSHQAYRIARENARRYLSCYVQESYRKLRHCNVTLDRLRCDLLAAIPHYLINELEDHVSKRVVNYRYNLKERFKDKFDNLKHRAAPQHASPAWITNISDRDLTDTEKSALNKGLNFALPNGTKDLPKFIANIESAVGDLRDVSPDEKTIIRHQICNAIRNAPPPDRNLTREEFTALKALQSDNNIIIAPADKGRSTVIINRRDYDEKVNSHLQDQETYSEIDDDPTPKLRKSINSFLKTLFDQKLFTKEEYQHLFATSAQIPLFYALVKIHKIGYPIRPIVSFTGSPSYNIARFLSKLLTPSSNKCVNKLKNAYIAKEKLKHVVIP